METTTKKISLDFQTALISKTRSNPEEGVFTHYTVGDILSKFLERAGIKVSTWSLERVAKSEHYSDEDFILALSASPTDSLWGNGSVRQIRLSGWIPLHKNGSGRMSFGHACDHRDAPDWLNLSIFAKTQDAEAQHTFKVVDLDDDFKKIILDLVQEICSRIVFRGIVPEQSQVSDFFYVGNEGGFITPQNSIAEIQVTHDGATWIGSVGRGYSPLPGQEETAEDKLLWGGTPSCGIKWSYRILVGAIMPDRPRRDLTHPEDLWGKLGNEPLTEEVLRESFPEAKITYWGMNYVPQDEE